jgi:hypothetical protein
VLVNALIVGEKACVAITCDSQEIAGNAATARTAYTRRAGAWATDSPRFR